MEKFYVKIDSELDSEYLQKKAFEAKFGWGFDREQVQRTKEPYLYFNEDYKIIEFGESGKSFGHTLYTLTQAIEFFKKKKKETEFKVGDVMRIDTVLENYIFKISEVEPDKFWMENCYKLKGGEYDNVNGFLERNNPSFIYKHASAEERRLLEDAIASAEKIMIGKWEVKFHDWGVDICGREFNKGWLKSFYEDYLQGEFVAAITKDCSGNEIRVDISTIKKIVERL